MNQVQVRGCLPALLTLLVLGALVALVISASLAVALPVAGALLVLGLARWAWYRVTGRRPRPVFRVATFRSIRIDPGGPVVDALPRKPRENSPGGG